MAYLLGGHPDEVPLTPEEEKAIRQLKALAKQWPKSLWLFSGSGSLCVMRNNAKGKHHQFGAEGTGMDQEYIVDQITGISNDGGDW